VQYQYRDAKTENDMCLVRGIISTVLSLRKDLILTKAKQYCKLLVCRLCKCKCKFIERVVIKKISHALNTMEPTLLCKQNCLKCRRKQASLIVGSLNATGRLFHAVGPATENARRPYVVNL